MYPLGEIDLQCVKQANSEYNSALPANLLLERLQYFNGIEKSKLE